MKRPGDVQSKPISLPPLPPPEPGSLDARLQAARLKVREVAALPRTDPARQRMTLANVQGASTSANLDTNPYPEDSVEAAAWLLGWWSNDQDERHR